MDDAVTKRTILYGRLSTEFSSDELDDLRFKLGWKDNDLWTSSATTDERARDLVEAAIRHNRLLELMQLVAQLRP